MTEQLPSDDDFFDNISQDWQEQTFSKIDSFNLVKKIRRRILYAKIGFGISLLVTIAFYIGLVYGLLADDWPTPHLIYVIVACIVLPIFLRFEYQARRSTWEVSDLTMTDAIDGAINSCQTGIKVMKLNQYSFLLVAPFIHWYLYEMAIIGEVSPAKVLIPSALVSIIALGATVWFVRKRKIELQNLMAISELK